MMASVEEGILDMIGPRTLEGGYSPSQVMSSAKRVVEEVDCSEILGAKATWWVARVAVWPAGTKAEETATIAARRRMLRRAIFEVYDFCKFSFCVVKKAREFLDEENRRENTISSIFKRKSLIRANSAHVQATLCSTVAADIILLSSNHSVTVDSSLLFEHI